MRLLLHHGRRQRVPGAGRAGASVAVSADARLLEPAEIAIALPAELPGWAAPIVAIVPAQVATLRLAELRGVAVDSPHQLSKVTLTS